MKKIKLLGLVLLLGVVLCGNCGDKVSKTVLAYAPVSWGLSHKGNEQIPTAPADGKALLDKYDGLYVALCHQHHSAVRHFDGFSKISSKAGRAWFGMGGA